MKTRYITEKDFVPKSIYQQERHNEVEDGLFQIVYGVMQYGMTYDNIYDLIVRISKEQKSEVVKRFKLLAWKVEVEAIIKKLQKLDVKDFNVEVVIPFTSYVEDVPYTINQFQLVLYTINEILDRGDEHMAIIANPNYDVPPKTISKLLEDYYLRFKNDLPEEMTPDLPYYRNLFFDEMIRRGMTVYRSDEVIVDPDTNEVVDSQRNYKLEPSQYFNQPEKFFDFMDLVVGEEWKKLRTKAEYEDSDITNSNPASADNSDKKKYLLGAVGTVFFMLQELSQEAVERKNKKKLIAMINYILDSKYDDDTTRTYVDKLLEISAKSHTFKFYSWVRKNLSDFGFVVPRVIEDGYTNKLQEKNR